MSGSASHPLVLHQVQLATPAKGDVELIACGFGLHLCAFGHMAVRIGEAHHGGPSGG